MSNPTPGPWRVARQDASVWTEGGDQVAQTAAVPGCGMKIHWSMDERQANARLIAAAPDLLEALEATTEGGHYRECLAGQRGYGTCSAVCDKVRAAITKATEAP